MTIRIEMGHLTIKSAIFNIFFHVTKFSPAMVLEGEDHGVVRCHKSGVSNCMDYVLKR